MYPNFTKYQKKENNTKEKIIEILSYDWPLSMKKIYYILKKRYNSGVTYQAVFKSINELTKNSILEKSEKKYKLNLSWVKDIHDQTEIIRVNYFTEKHTSLFNDSDSNESLRIFIFKTWFDVEKYIYYLQKNNILNSKKKETICIHHTHEWRPFFYLRAEYNWIKKLKEKGHEMYIVCSGTHLLDEWSKNFYRSLDCNIKLNIKMSETCETIIFSDLIIQIYLPYKLKEKLEKELKKVKKIQDLNIKKMIEEIFEKNSDIKVIINKDQKLADELKQQTLSYFKNS